MATKFSEVTAADAWGAPPCPRLLEIKRAQRDKAHPREHKKEEAHPLLAEKTGVFMRSILSMLSSHVEELQKAKDESRVGHIKRDADNGLTAIHLRAPAMDSFTYDRSLEWRQAPKGVAVPLQAQFALAGRINVEELESLKAEVVRALEGQSERLNNASPDLWGKKPSGMAELWARVKSLERTTQAKKGAFDPNFIKVRNYSVQKEEKGPYLREGFSMELRNEDYLLTFYPSEDGTKTVLRISALDLKDQSINDDPMDPLLLLESSEFTTWSEKVLTLLEVELEKASNENWTNELIEENPDLEVELSIRATLRALRDQLRERVVAQLRQWMD